MTVPKWTVLALAVVAAGWMVFGCRTFAPKYASSDASPNDR